MCHGRVLLSRNRQKLHTKNEKNRKAEMKRTARCLQGSEEEFGRYMSDPEKSTIWSKVPHSTANLTVESSQWWKYVTGLKDHLSSINNNMATSEWNIKIWKGHSHIHAGRYLFALEVDIEFYRGAYLQIVCVASSAFSIILSSLLFTLE